MLWKLRGKEKNGEVLKRVGENFNKYPPFLKSKRRNCEKRKKKCKKKVKMERGKNVNHHVNRIKIDGIESEKQKVKGLRVAQVASTLKSSSENIYY